MKSLSNVLVLFLWLAEASNLESTRHSVRLIQSYFPGYAAIICFCPDLKVSISLRKSKEFVGSCNTQLTEHNESIPVVKPAYGCTLEGKFTQNYKMNVVSDKNCNCTRLEIHLTVKRPIPESLYGNWSCHYGALENAYDSLEIKSEKEIKVITEKETDATVCVIVVATIIIVIVITGVTLFVAYKKNKCCFATGCSRSCIHYGRTQSP